MENIENVEGVENTTLEATYSKEAIVESGKYGDLAVALLKDDQLYTLKEVENLIDGYMKGVLD